MRDANQKMRFNEVELGLLKALFAENDELIFSIRKVLLQGELKESEKQLVKNVLNEQVYVLLTKFFNPWIDTDAPIHQMTDMILGLGSEIKELSPDGAWPYMQAKKIEIEYLDQQLKILNGSEEKPKIILSELVDLDVPKTQREELYINITARNFLLSFIDTMCAQIKSLAGLKNETVEETQKRLAQNSNK